MVGWEVVWEEERASSSRGRKQIWHSGTAQVTGRVGNWTMNRGTVQGTLGLEKAGGQAVGEVEVLTVVL